MTEQNRDNKIQVKTKRSPKRSRPVFIIVSTLAFCLFFWKFFIYESADKKFAALEVARAIDDSENAATVYDQLLLYDISVFEYDPQDAELEDITLAKPWPGKDYPELVKWFDKRREFTEMMLRASKIEKCRFPITDFPKGSGIHGKRMAATKSWVFFLTRSANNDIADGRTAQALEKCFCLIRMGRHYRQQPFALDFITGITIESLALRRMRICIVQSEPADDYLPDIEAAIQQPNDEWISDLQNMLAVEKIYQRTLLNIPSKSGWWNELKAWWQKKQDEKAKTDRIKQKYTQLLADRRGNQILIALRRFKNQNGRRPESLNELKSLATEDTFIDPQNNSPFVYKLADDGFILYSKGPNNIDENGIDKNGADDRAIWPLVIKLKDDKEQ